MTAKILDKLFSNISREEFFDKYFMRVPFSSVSGADNFAFLFNENVLSELIQKSTKNIYFADQGKQSTEVACESMEHAIREIERGNTLVATHAEELHANFSDLAKEFRDEFGSQTHVQLFWTPSQHEGFSSHYDLEDVFILQTKGRKKFTLRKNTVYPLPVHVDNHAQSLYEREGSALKLSCELEAGDWLYIPSGYWHKAHAISDSMHISLGIMPKTIDFVLSKLKTKLFSDVKWRKRLPDYSQETHSPADCKKVYKNLLKDLSTYLQQTLNDSEFLETVMMRSEEFCPDVSKERTAPAS
jgi:50S ribosomal protein L16 3-hydroxylase